MPDRLDRSAYPFASHWATVPAGRLHYVDEGSGPPLVFVHGTPSWSFEWRGLIRGLSRDYRCLALDHLGFGLSDRPREFAYTPEAHAENFQRFIGQVAPGPFTLVVHDFGGPIALPFCLRQPHQVARLVVLNSWMWSIASDPAMARQARFGGSIAGRLLYQYANFSLRVLMPYAYGDKRRLTPAVHRHYLDRFPDAWSRGTVLWQLAVALLGSSAHYDRLWQQRAAFADRPSLIVWGLKDRAFQPSFLARWRDALPAARVVEIPSAGHWPQEEAPDEVLSALRSFLADSADEVTR
ncbi:MAG: alpha/beta fold hydrolase [Vicinamibacterales bacterium]